jgi:two-component system, OmpR family, aerobic respiration control sensor histidine kinase ArcB
MDETDLEAIAPPERSNISINKQRVTKDSPVSEAVSSNGSRILVVEDQTIAARVAQSVLLELDCQVDIAPDGKTALERIEKQHYDLVLMDVGLPDSDGCEVTRRIRLKQQQRNSSVPIVGLTAHIEAEKKQSCLSNGMNAVYSKPLTAEKAVEILNVFVPRQTPSQTTIQSPTDVLQDFALIDVDRAIQLIGSKKFANETWDLLVSSLTEELAILKQYHQASDWLAIKALAHKWRGGASYCGANRLGQACQRLEAALQAESLEAAEKHYQQLLQVAEATKEAAKTAIASK